MGTIRIFNYPCEIGSAIEFLQCYGQHLNAVNNCVLSPDKKYLITTSEIDRCLFIWTIRKQQEQREKDESQEEGIREEKEEEKTFQLKFA